MTFWDLVDKHIDGIFFVICFLGLTWMITKVLKKND